MVIKISPTIDVADCLIIICIAIAIYNIYVLNVIFPLSIYDLTQDMHRDGSKIKICILSIPKNHPGYNVFALYIPLGNISIESKFI